MKICYEPRTFQAARRKIVDRANEIIEEYEAQGITLTVRQLYYQFIGRGWLHGEKKVWSNFHKTIARARLAGDIDWKAIEDRTRSAYGPSHDIWGDPVDEIISGAFAYAHHNEDMWGGQEYRVEVWVEKDALVDIIAEVCNELDVTYFSCRGEVSLSALHEAGARMAHYEVEKYKNGGCTGIILYLGDHDPTGFDIPRVIEERLRLFCTHQGYSAPEVRRIALTREQIKKFKLPPDWAKDTDSRAPAYIKLHGTSKCWELDALHPHELQSIVRTAVEDIRDEDIYKKQCALQEKRRNILLRIARKVERVLRPPRKKKKV